MATERELNKRIRSIGNISQVTSALAAVSAAKATKAQQQVVATRDYAGKAFEILINLASQPGVEGSNTHPLLITQSEIKNSALILITADRGLAGAYNTNIVIRAEQFLEAITTPVKIIAVGRKGRARCGARRLVAQQRQALERHLLLRPRAGARPRTSSVRRSTM